MAFAGYTSIRDMERSLNILHAYFLGIYLYLYLQLTGINKICMKSTPLNVERHVSIF